MHKHCGGMLWLLLLGGCRYHHVSHGYDYSDWNNSHAKTGKAVG